MTPVYSNLGLIFLDLTIISNSDDGDYEIWARSRNMATSLIRKVRKQKQSGDSRLM